MFRLALTLCLLPAAVYAVEPDLAPLVEEAQHDRIRRLVQQRDEIEVLRKNRKLDRKEKQRKIAEVEKRLSQTEDPAHPIFPYHETPLLKPGLVRHYGNGHPGKVFQVLDGEQALVEFVWIKATPVYGKIGGKRARVGVDRTEKRAMVLLKGVDTSAMRDGGGYGFKGWFYCTGNYTYETTTGTNTVPVVEPFDIKPQKDKFTRKREFREWELDGNKVKACIVWYERGKAHLIDNKGNRHEPRFSTLNEADRDAVAKWRERIDKMQAKLKPPR